MHHDMTYMHVYTYMNAYIHIYIYICELNVASAGSSKSQPTMLGTLGRFFRSTVSQDIWHHLGLSAPAKTAAAPNWSNVLVVNPKAYKAVRAACQHKTSFAIDIDVNVVAMADLICQSLEFDQDVYLPPAPSTVVHGVRVRGSLQLQIDSYHGANNAVTALPTDTVTLGDAQVPLVGGGNVQRLARQHLRLSVCLNV